MAVPPDLRRGQGDQSTRNAQLTRRTWTRRLERTQAVMGRPVKSSRADSGDFFMSLSLVIGTKQAHREPSSTSWNSPRRSTTAAGGQGKVCWSESGSSAQLRCWVRRAAAARRPATAAKGKPEAQGLSAQQTPPPGSRACAGGFKPCHCTPAANQAGAARLPSKHQLRLGRCGQGATREPQWPQTGAPPAPPAGLQDHT